MFTLHFTDQVGGRVGGRGVWGGEGVGTGSGICHKVVVVIKLISKQACGPSSLQATSSSSHPSPSPRLGGSLSIDSVRMPVSIRSNMRACRANV